MAYDSIRRYRSWYASLIRFHSRAHHARYGEGMEQTFSDILRERREEGRGLFSFALWMFIETSVGIIRENMITMNRTLKFVLGALCILFIPFFAMLFNVSGWDWHLFDYVVVGILLAGAGWGLAYATSNGVTNRQRLIGFAIVGLFILLYIHVAVGIVDWLPMAGS
jgi:hypothetical protein